MASAGLHRFPACVHGVFVDICQKFCVKKTVLLTCFNEIPVLEIVAVKVTGIVRQTYDSSICCRKKIL